MACPEDVKVFNINILYWKLFCTFFQMSDSKYKKYFSRVTADSMECLLCKNDGITKFYSLPKGGSTPGLRRHLVNIHQIVVNDPDVGPLGVAISKMVQKHAVEQQLVSSTEFKAIIQAARAEPREKIPTTTTLTEISHQDYGDLISTIKDQLKISRFASLILDHWSSSDHKSYIGIILDYLTPKFEYKSKLIDFEVVDNHEAVYTYDMINAQLQEFNLRTKLGGIIGDSTASMKKTLEITAKETKAFPHLCFAHIFQLCINEALDASDNVPLVKALGELKKIVDFTRNSPKFLLFLKKRILEKENNFNTPKKANKTRWDSTFLMLESTVFSLDYYNDALEVYRTKHKYPNVPPTIGLSTKSILKKL